MTDDFAVVYTGMLRPLAPYELLPKLMMEPPPIFFMPGTTAWMAKNAGRWFTAMRAS